MRSAGALVCCPLVCSSEAKNTRKRSQLKYNLKSKETLSSIFAITQRTFAGRDARAPTCSDCDEIFLFSSIPA